MVGHGYLSSNFQAFVAHMAADQWVNEKSSYAEYVQFGILDFTDLMMAMSVYSVDCGNIAHRSCCD